MSGSRSRPLVILGAVLACILLAQAAIAAGAGSFDASFGTGGLTFVAQGGKYDWNLGRAVEIQDDGKILIAVSVDGSTSQFNVIRLTTTGALDTTFSGDGIAKIAVLDNDWDVTADLAIQDDGKIVLTGSAVGDFSMNKVGVVRLLADGTPDDTFGDDGRVVEDFGTGEAYGRAVEIQDDGKIVVAAWGRAPGGYDFGLMRFDDDGSLDDSFSGDGKALTSIGPRNDTAESMVIQDDGAIVVGGSTKVDREYHWAFARFDTTGELDDSFSGDGTLVLPGTFASVTSLENSPGSTIMAAGYDWPNKGAGKMRMFRLLDDGTLDPTFSSDGKFVKPVGKGAQIDGLVVQADGKVIGAGWACPTNRTCTVAMVRVLTDGTLDPTFSGDGLVTPSRKKGVNRAYAAAIDADGKIVLTGESAGDGRETPVARFLAA